MIALAAITYGSVHAHGTPVKNGSIMAVDTTKKKMKGDKSKMKSDTGKMRSKSMKTKMKKDTMKTNM